MTKNDFSGKRILVIGDVMLDKYVYGDTLRLSAEASVPIILYQKTEYRLGGAANVAANIKALGGNPLLVGLAGDDDGGAQLNSLLKNSGIQATILDSKRQTTLKTRIIANRQQIARIDDEDTSRLPADVVQALIRHLTTSVADVSAIIISDYAKGIIVNRRILSAVTYGRNSNIPLFIDPKVSNGALYECVDIYAITPNSREAEGLVPDSRGIDSLGRGLLDRYKCNHAVITRGDQGISVFSSDKYSHTYIPATARDVFDVSGAGDTVIAALALGTVSGMSIVAAAQFANAAAGVVVGKHGTAMATIEEVLASGYKFPGGTMCGTP